MLVCVCASHCVVRFRLAAFNIGLEFLVPLGYGEGERKVYDKTTTNRGREALGEGIGNFFWTRLDSW